ncbi:MAG: DUF1775 domain-containing protein [Lautropia sp.]|nr:DUF1775 domain-containing protein [Lautropia sp.]
MKIRILTLTAALALGMATAAQAHVTVRNLANGVDSIAGKSDTFRLNVPTNRGKAITAVKMEMPKDSVLLFVHPVPGWKYSTTTNAEGQIIGITYQGRMEAGEFISFPFIAKTPKSAVEPMKFRAWVTYEDEVVVPFDGSEAAKGYQPTIQLQ